MMVEIANSFVQTNPILAMALMVVLLLIVVKVARI
jgi:hypothetical protein